MNKIEFSFNTENLNWSIDDVTQFAIHKTQKIEKLEKRKEKYETQIDSVHCLRND